VKSSMSVPLKVLRGFAPWLLALTIGVIGGLLMRSYLKSEAGAETILWRLVETDGRPWRMLVLILALFAGAVGFLAFHLHRRRSAAMGFSQVGLVGARGVASWLSDLPGVLRVLAVVAIGVALARPETYRTVIHETDSIDIMIVFDMSKSMEETDLPRDRMDAAQRVVRRFVRRNKNDRIGLVIFGQQAMMHTPLTADSKVLEQIVADLTIGDVPELGTAIGDGLAMALAQLRRSDGQCVPGAAVTEKTCPENFTCSDKGYCEGEGKHKRSKVVILLSDGDNNWVTRFGPDESARTAASMGVKVYTVLVGREESDLFGGMSVNPATLKSIAQLTGGEFFRATDYESFDRGFQTVRSQLNATKRVRKERLPDKQLFLPLAMLAALLIALEIILSHTRLRRLP
jgi:Ca-activated chloride channel family protein